MENCWDIGSKTNDTMVTMGSDFNPARSGIPGLLLHSRGPPEDSGEDGDVHEEDEDDDVDEEINTPLTSSPEVTEPVKKGDVMEELAMKIGLTEARIQATLTHVARSFIRKQ
eukprot:TCALIF_05168-PA protein Name:"Protein of unknown function" AED:0.61 eAED:0.61 QI:0/0/0.16/0.33/1/1/6/0/111